MPLAIMGVLTSSFAAAQTTLESIDFVATGGDEFQIELRFSDMPPLPEVFEIESPARLSMDFNGVSSDLQKRRYPLPYKIADSVMVLEAQGRTRMVVNLASSTNYVTSVKGNSLIVTIGDRANEVAKRQPLLNQQIEPVAQVVQSRPVRPVVVQQQKVPSDIDGVEFRRTANGAGKIIIALANEGVVGAVRQTGNVLRLEFQNADINDAKQERLDVTDFATPVQFIDVYAEDDNVVIVADIYGQYEYVAYQKGGEYIIDVSPITAAVTASVEDEFEFVGERLDLNYQDIPVRSVLQLLADFNDFSLVVSDTVTGNITLRLNDVPWDQALDIILTIEGLDKRLSGNVLYIAPAEEIAEAELQVLENNIQIESLAPLVTEYIRINYAVADEILILLEGEDDNLNSGANGGGNNSGGLNNEGYNRSNRILTDRGSASVDERTNTLIVQDVATVMVQIREMLNILDVPNKQVLIEARIVNASTQFSESLGVRWGLAQTFPSAGDGFVIGGGLDSVTNGLVTGAGSPNSLSFPQALMVDMGAAGASSSIALGYAGDDALIQLELSALESSGNGEVIAEPKLLTQDLHTAHIESGVQIPYQAQAGGTAGGSTTEFVPALLSLEVTPQITPDGRIIMLIDIHQDSVIAADSGAVPAIATNAISTRVLVNDGSTIVLGGVFREETTTNVNKTPVLGDLPYLGRLFKRTDEFETKTELLIFITPSIINDLP